MAHASRLMKTFRLHNNLSLPPAPELYRHLQIVNYDTRISFHENFPIT